MNEPNKTLDLFESPRIDAVSINYLNSTILVWVMKFCDLMCDLLLIGIILTCFGHMMQSLCSFELWPVLWSKV